MVWNYTHDKSQIKKSVICTWCEHKQNIIAHGNYNIVDHTSENISSVNSMNGNKQGWLSSGTSKVSPESYSSGDPRVDNHHCMWYSGTTNWNSHGLSKGTTWLVAKIHYYILHTDQLQYSVKWELMMVVALDQNNKCVVIHTMVEHAHIYHRPTRGGKTPDKSTHWSIYLASPAVQ